MNRCRLLAVLGILLMPACVVHSAELDDRYIAGYATGILKYSFNQDKPSLSVREGVVTLRVADLDASEQAALVRIVSEIPGVQAVKLTKAAPQAPEDARFSEPIQVAEEEKGLSTGVLPDGQIFKPLLADPRWPHFSAAYRNYRSNNFDGRHIGSVSFGETIPFYRANFGQTAVQWEAGIQGGIFSDFNLGASSSDLVNTDFIGAIYSSLRAGRFSAFARIYHQSSHLGDEFLLRHVSDKFERVNLSYEGLDLKLSYELPLGLRIYGGGVGLFHREPEDMKPWSTQYGMEFRSPWRFEFAAMRPIVAADFKNFEENDWNTDVSVRAGVEFENTQVLGRKLQVLVEYFNGFSPSGQFYNEKVEYIGLGAHYLF